jgi:hypothetical protein
MKEIFFNCLTQKEKLGFLNYEQLPFVFSHPYHLFLNTLGYETFLFIGKKEELIPFCIKRTRFIKNVYLLHPVLKDNKRLLPENEKKIFNEFIQELKKGFKPDRISSFVPIEVSYSTPDNSKYGEFGNVSIDLEGNNENNIFSSFQPSSRNIIRKSQKQGAIVKFGPEVFDDFFTIYSETLKRQNLFFDQKKQIESFYNMLMTGQGGCICAVVYNSKMEPEGSLFVPYTIYGGYSYYAGSAMNPEIRGSIKYLHWVVIKHLMAKGVKRFIFGGVRIHSTIGAKYKGLRDFKMSFGSSLQKGYLWKYEYSSKKLYFYNLAVRLKTRLKNQKYLPDLVDQINI